ncbi:MAG: AMP-binding protein [Sutterellaceae bacterium]|nr:AMP-binding protein [Sutterellaceae bacterium]
MSDSDMHSETAFSIFAAARDCPQGLCVRSPDKDYSFAETAELAKADLEHLQRPRPGRPYILTAKADLATLVRIYALLEARVPMLLLSPKLTPIEVKACLDRIEAIEAPLPENAAAVLFTSGTTGRSKPAILTRSALFANAKAVNRHIRLTQDDVWQLSISPARVGGFGVVTRSLARCSAVALAPNYSAKAYLESFVRDRISIASLVPTMLSDMLDTCPDWRTPETLRLVLIGGAACSSRLRQRAQKAHVPIVTTYAMTETASTVAMSRYESRFDPQSSGNVPLDGVELKSAEGELFVRGPMTMAGYWGASPLLANEWLDTGDRARTLPDGSFEILGRVTDTIVSGAEKVYPDEVERALCSIAGIKEALVLGLPDDKWGAIVAALLVAETEPVETVDLIGKLTQNLARYKCPRRIAWVKELPQTLAGKYARSPEILHKLALETVHYTTSKVS